MGVKILSQHALLGSYDFVNILEAESNEEIAKLSIKITAGGKLIRNNDTALRYRYQ
ncbi:MAG: GYD domain-containing protein [Methanophagales archaeon]|nr:GYD domain-containing protein [Methanophagales archaeon]